MTAVLAWQNYVKSSVITDTGSTAANMPSSNVANDQGSPSAGWQTATLTAATITMTPATGAQTWRVLGIFGTNLTPAALVGFQLWNTAGGTPFTANLPGPVAGYGQVVCVIPTDVIADFLMITITDAANPDGFINVPLVFGGPAWFPAGSTGFDSSVGRDVQVDEVITRGGQEYPTLLWQRRRWNVTLDSLRQSETWANADPLFRIANAGGNVFHAPNSASPNLQQESIFGRLKGAADITYPYQGADRRRWQASITERL